MGAGRDAPARVPPRVSQRSPALPDPPDPQLPTSTLRNEVLVVFAVSLGASGLRAALDLIGSVTERGSLSAQHTSLIVSAAPGRPWLDLAYQLVGIATSLAPVALVLHLVRRSGDRIAGLDLDMPGRDALRGGALAAVVGGAGLGLYLIAHALGLALTVDVVDLPPHWWRIPVELLSALHDGLLEEILVVGYLLHRLRQLGWSDTGALAASATLRGSYHLYQGFGGFLGNAVMGVIFGVLFRRWGRVMPLIIAHTLIDSVAFVGYTELVGKVSWLPM